MSGARLSRTRPPTIAAVAEVTAAIEAWALALDVPQRALRALLLIHDELASNVARYGKGAKRMAISCRLDSRRRLLHYRLEDDGAAYDVLARDEPDTTAPLAERTPGGLGIHLVRTLARAVRWRRVEGKNRTEIELAFD